MSVRQFSTFLSQVKSSSRVLTRPWQHFYDRMTVQPDSQGFLCIGDYQVFAWSLSGIETTVVVKQRQDGFTCCFDMGYACRANVKCDHVLISHGHMDHISAIPQHNRKRELSSLRPTKYYMLPHLVEPLKQIYEQYMEMNENAEGRPRPDIVEVNQGELIKLNRGYFAKSFPTVHRVKSQGYLLYKTRKKVKAEFADLSQQEIGARRQKGEDVIDIITTPEIAYTGDTTFEIFTNGQTNPDIFNVKLLIVEATYINNGDTYDDCVAAARKWGHIDLVEFSQNAHLFENVDNILLIHFSDKYTPSHIENAIAELPESIKDKVFVATLAKQRYL